MYLTGMYHHYKHYENLIRATHVSIAKEFQCYSCESTFSSKSTSSEEPKYDSVKLKDKSLCWEVLPPSATTVSTGTTGQCFGECYTQAYKYSLAIDSGREFYWNIKRGCSDDEKYSSLSLYGVKVRQETCSFQNETLCNAHIGNYPTSLELKSQPAKKLQCYICQTTDSDNCLEPAQKFISDCPDISYDCCYLRKRGSY